MSKEVHRIYFCKDGAILDTQIREGEDVTDTLKRCFKKISDLEAKLAEKEHTINTLIEDHKASQEWYKKQLAEKEKENDELQDKLHSYYEQIMNKGTCGLCEYVRTNYKISFAVEQLEKVKEDINKYNKEHCFLWVEEYVCNKSVEIIDNQIKQLKEGK